MNYLGKSGTPSLQGGGRGGGGQRRGKPGGGTLRQSAWLVQCGVSTTDMFMYMCVCVCVCVCLCLCVCVCVIGCDYVLVGITQPWAPRCT